MARYTEVNPTTLGFHLVAGVDDNILSYAKYIADDTYKLDGQEEVGATQAEINAELKAAIGAGSSDVKSVEALTTDQGSNTIFATTEEGGKVKIVLLHSDDSNSVILRSELGDAVEALETKINLASEGAKEGLDALTTVVNTFKEEQESTNTELDGKITNLAGRVSANEGTISQHTTSIDANFTAIEALGTVVANNAEKEQNDVNALTTRINNVESDLSSAVNTFQQNFDEIAQAKGAANGFATLDASGLVPSSQLPSYVDDVIEVANKAALPETGESGKIYVTLDDNLTYRWSGTQYVEISKSLALGETSSTAYAGDKGKATAEALATLRSEFDNLHEYTTDVLATKVSENTAAIEALGSALSARIAKIEALLAGIPEDAIFLLANYEATAE